MVFNATNVEQVTGQGCWQIVQNANWNIVIHVSGDILVNENIK